MKPIQPLVDLQAIDLAIGGQPILRQVSLKVYPKEIVAMVGESGSGKSITALSLLGLLPKNTQLQAAKMDFDGKDLRRCTPKDWQQLRGRSIGMIFQEPQSSLNPSMRCGTQLLEVLQHHQSLSKATQIAAVYAALKEVQLEQVERIFKSYPHELSGGQKQRIMIAMALLCKPQLLIADEPTTALDVTVQKEIIALLQQLQKRHGMSILFISHDLALVGQLADRVVVLYQGQVVEENTAVELFEHPQHPYTKGLLFARPSAKVRWKTLPTFEDYHKGAYRPEIVSTKMREKKQQVLYQQTPLLTVKGLVKHYDRKRLLRPLQRFTAIEQMDFSLYPGETLGLVGESGCGKSTLAKALIFLDPPSLGEIRYLGKRIHNPTTNELKQLRRDIQFIFQDPFAALHPLKSIGNAIVEVLEVHRIKKNYEQLDYAHQLLEQVGLSGDFFERYPHELSGGQRQRVVIARALATAPKILICDESVAALDISVQAQVLNLLNRLKKELGLSYLFISHDLSVVKYMSDRVMVMERGKLVELQEADALYAHPKHPYTQKLIDAIPQLS